MADSLKKGAKTAEQREEAERKLREKNLKFLDEFSKIR